jgi:hypothetical protein
MRCKSEQLSPKWGARDVPWGCRNKIHHRVLAPKNVLVLARVSTEVSIYIYIYIKANVCVFLSVCMYVQD